MPVLHRLLKVVAWFIITAISGGIAFVVGGAFTLFTTAYLDPDSIRPTPAIVRDQSNLLQIGRAAFIYAVDHQDKLPQADTIWNYAAHLSNFTGLEETFFWITANLRPSAKKPVLLPGPKGSRGIDPKFLAQTPTIAVASGQLTLAMPSTTPIAWTAGLKTDGYWSPDSAYGGNEGLIFFLGGNVARYSNLHENGGALVHFNTGQRTANILEALPPGTTILEAQQPASSEALKRIHQITTVRRLIGTGWSVWLISVFAPINFLLLRAFGLHHFRAPMWLLIVPAAWALGQIIGMIVLRQL